MKGFLALITGELTPDGDDNLTPGAKAKGKGKGTVVTKIPSNAKKWKDLEDAMTVEEPPDWAVKTVWLTAKTLVPNAFKDVVDWDLKELTNWVRKA